MYCRVHYKHLSLRNSIYHWSITFFVRYAHKTTGCMNGLLECGDQASHCDRLLSPSLNKLSPKHYHKISSNQTITQRKAYCKQNREGNKLTMQGYLHPNYKNLLEQVLHHYYKQGSNQLLHCMAVGGPVKSGLNLLLRLGET